jgi:hypothetical protein
MTDSLSDRQRANRSRACLAGKLPVRSSFSVTAILLAAALTATSAQAQNGERQHSVAGTAADAATQPLEDFNLKSRKIPAVLIAAQDAPYETASLDGCAALQTEIFALDGVLGPDADAEADKPGLMRGALQTGGDLLSSFIPFRGVVRSLSGANRKRAEMAAAVYAGIARRSYLKGYAAAQKCETTRQSVADRSVPVPGSAIQDDPVTPQEGAVSESSTTAREQTSGEDRI